MDFTKTWQRIQAELRQGTTISNWTVKKGYLGDIFTVVDISLTYVKVETPKAKNHQPIPKEDFEAVYNVWNDYCRGSVQRQEIRDMTRYSKYIISILHHFEM